MNLGLKGVGFEEAVSPIDRQAKLSWVLLFRYIFLFRLTYWTRHSKAVRVDLDTSCGKAVVTDAVNASKEAGDCGGDCHTDNDRSIYCKIRRKLRNMGE